MPNEHPEHLRLYNTFNIIKKRTLLGSTFRLDNDQENGQESD